MCFLRFFLPCVVLLLLGNPLHAQQGKANDPSPSPFARIASDRASALAFSPDGKTLAVSGRDCLLLHDLKGKNPSITLVATPPPSESRKRENLWQRCVIAFSADGQRIAAGWDSGHISVWHVATGKLLWQSHEHEYDVQSLEFVANDKTLVSSGRRDGQLIWWNVLTGRRERKLAQNLEHESYAQGLIHIGPGAQTAFFRGSGRTFTEWELSTGKARRELNTGDYPYAISGDGRFMLSRFSPACFNLIDLRSGKYLRSFACVAGKATSSMFVASCFSPDGRIIAAVAEDEVVRLWERDTATVLATCAGHLGGPLAVAFAPDGKTLATSAGAGTIFLWHVPALSPRITPVLSLPDPKPAVVGKDNEGEPLPQGATARLGSLRFQHGAEILGLRYSSDGRSILALTTTAADGVSWTELLLWNATSGKITSQLPVAWAFGGGPPLSGPPHIDTWSVSADANLVATSSTYSEKKKSARSRGFSIREISSGNVIFENKDGEPLSGARLSPDAKKIVGIYDLTVLDLSNGTVSKLPNKDEKAPIREAAFSPDGKFVLGWNWSGLVQWWRLEPGGGHASLPLKFSDCGVVFHPDSKQIAGLVYPAKDAKARLVLVDLESGKVSRDFGEHKAYWVKMQFSPDGKQLMTLTTLSRSGFSAPTKEGERTWHPSRQVVRRWEVASGKQFPDIETSDGVSAGYSPDSRILAIGTGQHLILLDANSGRELRRLPIDANFPQEIGRSDLFTDFDAEPFAFSPDGKRIAVVANRVIREFDVATGAEIGPTPHWQTTLGLSASSGGRWVASWSLGYVQVWDVAKKQVVFRVEPWSKGTKGGDKISLSGAAFSPAGNRLAVSASDGDIALFDVASAKKLLLLSRHQAPLTGMEFLADGSTLISSDASGLVAIWNMESGKLMRTHSLPGLISKKITAELEEGLLFGLMMKTGKTPGDWVLWHDLASLAPSARWLVIPGEKQVRLHELETSKSRVIETSRHPWTKVAVSADGRHLVVIQGKTLKVLDTHSGKEVRALSAPSSSAEGVSSLSSFTLSTDGNLLAAFGRNGIWLWNVATGTRLAELNGHRGEASALAFSPDGSTLYSGGLDGTILVWDLATLLARPKIAELSPEELTEAWQQLAEPDAGAAFRAMQRLIQHPHQATTLFAGKLKPAAAVPKEVIAKWVADLNDDRPKVRSAAMLELEKLAELADTALRNVLAGTPTLEQRMRAEKLLARVTGPITDGEKLRGVRGTEVLALIGTPEAIELLRSLIDGPESAFLTRAAKGALRRLGYQIAIAP